MVPSPDTARDVELPAERVRALLHAHQSQAAAVPAHGLGIETRTVIDDRQLDIPAGSCERDDQVARITVDEPVAKRLLSHAKQADGDLAIDMSQVAVGDEAHVNPLTLPDL